MKTRRRRNVLKDRLTITQRNKRSKKNIENEREENSSFPIPVDLIMEIFSRLPVKSIASCRCVSKPWASILRRSDFTELFLTRSSARPQLLFACMAYSEVYFFSSPQPQNLDEKSSHVVVDYHTKFSFDDYSSKICYPLHGLVCFTKPRISKGREETVPVIYNPSTGQSLRLPKVNTASVFVATRLGYDPIGKQFKLLSMTTGVNNVLEEHQVLTIGTGNHSWRMIECSRPYYSSSVDGICIEGVLYYPASDNIYLWDSLVVSFDVRSEKLRFIQIPEIFITSGRKKLINYNGKFSFLGFERSSSSIELCVLEDAEKHDWSKHTYVLPVLWQNIFGTLVPCVIGMTRTNEIVLAGLGSTVFFYVFYYSIERKTITCFQIRGLEAFKNKKVFFFLDHVEDLKLLCDCFN